MNANWGIFRGKDINEKKGKGATRRKAPFKITNEENSQFE